MNNLIFSQMTKYLNRWFMTNIQLTNKNMKKFTIILISRKLKLLGNIITHILECLKLKSLTLLCTGEDFKQLEVSYIVAGNLKC